MQRLPTNQALLSPSGFFAGVTCATSVRGRFRRPSCSEARKCASARGGRSNTAHQSGSARRASNMHAGELENPFYTKRWSRCLAVLTRHWCSDGAGRITGLQTLPAQPERMRYTSGGYMALRCGPIAPVTLAALRMKWLNFSTPTLPLRITSWLTM